MATDMVTSPMTLRGQAIFGLGCGITTMVIRYFAGYPEGVSLAILLMNAVTPLIDRAFKPKSFWRGEIMKEYLKMGVVLLIYCAVAGLALGLVYTLTKDRISLTELQQKINAIEKVLKDENGQYIVPIEEVKRQISRSGPVSNVIYEDSNGKVYSPVYKFESELGTVYVLSGSAIGYGGSVTIVASFVEKQEGLMLFSIRVTDFSQETPGLGARIGEEEIQKRFYPMEPSALENSVRVDKDANMTGLSVEEARQKGIAKVSDVMTGATITPRAVANAINAMLSYLKSGVKQ
jgi:electron transport complex, RnfABCDGE type, G subunit